MRIKQNIKQKIHKLKMVDRFKKNSQWFIGVCIIPIIVALITICPYFSNFKSAKIINEDVINLLYSTSSQDLPYNKEMTRTDSWFCEAYFKGCALSTHIDNPKDKNIAISKSILHIDEIVPVDYTEIGLTSIVIDNQLKICAINNSNMQIDNCKATFLLRRGAVSSNYNEEIEVSKYLSNTTSNIEHVFGIQSGEIKEIFNFVIDSKFLEAFENENEWIDLYVAFTINGKSDEIMAGTIEQSNNGGINVFHTQGNADHVQYYTQILDVDSVHPGDSIEIPISKPVERTSVKNIQTVILPNRSCEIKFWVEYFVNGKQDLKTDIYDAKIHVPIYEIYEGGYEDVYNFLEEHHISNYKLDKNSLSPKPVLYDPIKCITEFE